MIYIARYSVKHLYFNVQIVPIYSFITMDHISSITFKLFILAMFREMFSVVGRVIVQTLFRGIIRDAGIQLRK